LAPFRAGPEIGSAIIVYGAEEPHTPRGPFALLSKHPHYRARRYGADLPNARFTTQDGVALHISVLKPTHATHGCVGLPEEFSQRLFAIAEIGSAVDIIRSDPESVERLAAAASPSIH
ncbi:MAG: L,D-transpeptidase family protein, partial [Erythrobacteraceae bacterium]